MTLVKVSGILMYLQASTDNQIYNKVVSLGTTSLGEATSRTFINRLPDNRALDDRIYRYRYVIPSGVGIQSKLDHLEMDIFFRSPTM